MRAAAIAPLVAFAIACIPKADYVTAPDPIELTLFVETEFTPAEVQAIVRGARDWVTATEGITIEIRIEDCYESRHGLSSNERCVIVRSGEEIEEQWHSPNSVALHVGGHERLILLDKWHLSLRTLQTAASHEIGHAFGLRHSEPGTVMAEMITDQVAPNCKDVRALWKIRHGAPGPCYVKEPHAKM